MAVCGAPERHAINEMERRKCHIGPCRTDVIWALLISTIFLVIVDYVQCVKITRLSVPEVIQYGDQDSVVLDCEYEANDTRGLVIKWFFMNKTQPVYQWIPDKKPQDLGILRGKLDLNYKVSHKIHHMHRALRILNPGTELSGEYTCVVSTFMDEDKRTKQMIVFVPEKNFRLTQKVQAFNLLKVMCSAEDMYPQPNISLYSFERHLDGVRSSVIAVRGRYTASAHALLQDDTLATPTQFVCELKIPQAKYYVKKETIYYPGRLPITPELVTAAETQVADYNQGVNGAVGLKNTIIWLLAIGLYFTTS